MNLKIKTSNIIFIFFASICAFSTNFISTNSYSIAYKSLSVILLVEIIVFLIANKKNSGDFLNFSTLFIILLLLFNFGQVFLIGFFPKALINKTVVLKYFSVEEGFYALKWINYSFLCFCTFILLGAKNEVAENKKNKTNYFVIENNIQTFIKRSFILIAITFPLKLFIDVNFLIKSLSKGFNYGKIWLNSFPNFLVTIADFSMIGFAFLIVSLKNEPKKQLKWFIFVVLYLLILMISGRRSENVSYLCVILLLFLSTRKKKYTKFSIKKVFSFLSIIVFSYILLLFLYTVVHTRTNDSNSLAYVIDKMFYYNQHENIILEEMREYGQTGYTAICVINNWLTNYSPSYGTSYYLGLSAIFPNVGGFMGTLTEQSTYGLVLQQTKGVLDSLYTNIGGNLIGEFYFNFGKIGGIFLSCLFGYFVGWINTQVSYSLRKDKYTLIYMIPIMFSILYLIRDYFGDSIRSIIWGLIICAFLKKISVKKIMIGEIENESFNCIG